MRSVDELILSPPKSTSLRKFFRDLFSRDDPESGRKYQVLDVASANRDEIYLAIEESDPATGERRVGARLCLPAQGEDESVRAYRSIDEDESPVLTNCPLRILYLLTPTKDVNALRWRLKCLEKQVEGARRAYKETKRKYAATINGSTHFIRKSAETMIERRHLILHQALSATQTVRALLADVEREEAGRSLD